MRKRRPVVLIVAILTVLNTMGGTALSDLIIQDLLYNGPGGDSPSVFTELLGMPGMSLKDYALVGINGNDGTVYRTISLTGAVIPADGLLTIATGSANADLVLVRDFIANVDWQNGPGDAIQLKDPSSVVVDSLQYAGAANVGFWGETSPAVDTGDSMSLSRDMFGTDTNNNAVDFSAGIPSPGIGVVVPIPSAAVLGVLGLSVAGARLRKRVKVK